MEVYFESNIRVEVIYYKKGIPPNKYGWTPPEPEEIELRYVLEIDTDGDLQEYEVPYGSDLYKWLDSLFEKKMLNLIRPKTI